MGRQLPPDQGGGEEPAARHADHPPSGLLRPQAVHCPEPDGEDDGRRLAAGRRRGVGRGQDVGAGGAVQGGGRQGLRAGGAGGGRPFAARQYPGDGAAGGGLHLCHGLGRGCARLRRADPRPRRDQGGGAAAPERSQVLRPCRPLSGRLHDPGDGPERRDRGLGPSPRRVRSCCRRSSPRRGASG
jgi:hypothetical protein